MARTQARKEPILEESKNTDSSVPLVLTRLLREGLPPPLWRHSGEEIPPVEFRYPPDSPAPGPLADAPMAPFAPVATTAESAATTAAQPEESPTSEPFDTAAHAPYAGTAPHWQGSSAPDEPVPHVQEQSIEEHELAITLARIRGTETIPPAETPAPHAAAPLDTETTPETPSAVTETEPPPAIAEEIEATPPLPFDLDFLKNFETLLFHEIERRITHEMEERVTQHLQTLWKEQVSLAVMRTLALEGIRLRESLVKELQRSLPEILQRVLHEGLDQLTPTENESRP